MNAKRTLQSMLRGLATAALLLPLAFAAGCEDGHHGGGGSSSIAGTWKLTAISEGESGYWFVHFADDGSWRITDDAEGKERTRAKGDYTTSGDSFKGSMVNPGVGDGEIEGKVTNGAMTFDFIEHWHSPYKHNVYSGEKL